jgi:asparagine synthase (glutamine-hydrolysing)
MCGICGAVNFDRQQYIGRSDLEAMNQQIVHRGPDECGSYLSENVGLAMRRLRIVDLKTGQQPMSNEDGSLRLVYNGEIYNHQELRSRLEARGHRYRSQSDTETIVHLYEEYGRDCVRHLRGMFAFALWDAQKRRLFAARDRLGIKPFYYLHTPELFLFGSEIKTLLAYPGVRSQMNRACLPEYLAFGYLSGPETMFEGIYKLPPGHTLEVDESGDLNIEQYWDLDLQETEDVRSRHYYAQGYRDLLEQAVSSHLMSDVPLGVFLSGGLDSSVVAALTTKIKGEPIKTFSVGYEETPYSELSFAREVADHIGSDHHEVHVNPREFLDSLPKLIWHEDEPIVWPSSVALYHVAKLAREHVTVVLTGEGSDETLAGYTRYPWTIWNARFDSLYRNLVPSSLRRRLRNTVADSSLLPAGARRKLEHTFLGRDGDSWASFYFDNFYSAFSASEREGVLTDDFQTDPGVPYQNSMRFWKKSKGDLLTRLLYTDIKTYLVELLMKQDSMSMAASIESRVPFLDHTVVEYAVKIPSQFKTRGLNGKHILKTAVEDLLPKSIICRPKMGFPTPWRSWLEGPQLEKIEALLLEPRAVERDIFKREAVRGLFAEHRSRVKDHSNRIWRLLNLELWQRLFLESDCPSDLNNHTAMQLREPR